LLKAAPDVLFAGSNKLKAGSAGALLLTFPISILISTYILTGYVCCLLAMVRRFADTTDAHT
jgi:hypothetical protein